jgi:myo-inositol catabolism protein IolC
MDKDTEEFWAAYREEVDYPGLTGMDASAKERLDALPDFEGFMVGGPIKMTDLYCLPKDTLDAWVQKYISHIEDSPTAEVCKCTWLIHPDDVELPPVKQRKKVSIQHSRCMVHTKLGFLTGFFLFTFPEESADAKDE